MRIARDLPGTGLQFAFVPADHMERRLHVPSVGGQRLRRLFGVRQDFQYARNGQHRNQTAHFCREH